MLIETGLPKRLQTERSTHALVEDLEQQIPPLMRRAGVPGLSLALVRDGKIAWEQGFGVRSVTSQEPVTRDTVFEAASLTKPVFAWVCLSLCEAGLLDLDAPLAAYLPEPYAPDEPRLNLITLRHVLCHSTGLPNWRPKGESLRLYFAPGSRFSYSGEGYVYLQAVVAHVLGQSLVDHIENTYLRPLGMRNSRLVWTESETLLVAVGHNGERKLREKGLWTDFNAAASLHCTAGDFARFMCAVMRPSTEHSVHLGPEMTKLMLTPRVQVSEKAPWHKDWAESPGRVNDLVGWSLGWGTQRTSSGISIWHWGDNGCYRAFVVGFPDQGHGIVIMTNSENGQQIIGQILRDIVRGDYPGLDWIERMYRG